MTTPYRRSLGFLALAMIIGAPFAVLYGWAADGPVTTTLAAAIYMFSPLAAAVVFARRGGVPMREALGLRPHRSWWWLAAWVIPLGFGLGATALGFAMPGASYAPDMSGMFDRYADRLSPEQIELMKAQVAAIQLPPALIVALALVQAAIAGATINAVAALGEETGWRGWLHRELRGEGFWRSSLWIGALWGLWHAPLVLQGHNYPEHPVAGVLGMVLFCGLLAPSMTLVRDRTGSSLATAVFHGVLNAVGGLPLIYLRGGSDLTVGMTGAAGLLALVALNLALLAGGAGRAEPEA